MAVTRLLLLALLLAAALSLPTPAAAKSCPDVRFMTIGSLVYRGEQLPAGVELPTGATAGSGELDAPTSDDNCDRGTSPATALSLHGFDPGVAVAVEGQPGWIYVLGYRCDGLPGIERIDCLREPLLLDGVAYFARRYPQQNPPPRTFTPGEPVGEAELGGERVPVVAIDGVDPGVAVAVEGRPDDAYIASETCLYVAADNRPRYDGLARCLAAPVWLLFEPPLAKTDEPIVARADRRVAAELHGAPVLFVPAIGGDALPDDLADAVTVGSLDVTAGGSATVRFDVPGQLERAVYESVVRCDACAATESGKTTFAAGVFIVTDRAGGLGGRSVAVLALVLLLVALGVSALFLRRARRRPGVKDGRAGSAGGVG